MAKTQSKAEPEVSFGMERTHDIPWNATKVAIFKALKALKAKDSSSGRSAIDVADKAGFPADDNKRTTKVRHYCYHAKAAGLVQCGKVEGVSGYAFWLTAKGLNVDPVKAFKEQEAAKVKAAEKK